MRVFVIGRAEILYESALQLLEAGHSIVGIVTAPGRPEYQRTERDFQQLAERCGAPFLIASRIDDAVIDMVVRSAAEIGISVNWVSVTDHDFCSLFPHGVLNAHFGDLPRFRGNAVTNWALLMGETEIAMTVHMMMPGQLDAGDILAQARMPLTDMTTIADINATAAREVPHLFAKAVAGLSQGTLKPQPQSERGLQAFRCYPRLPRDGTIDWSVAAPDIHALVRSATRPYTGAFTYYRDAGNRLRRLRIWETRIEATNTHDIGVPGHVLHNDSQSGESLVMTGHGILALRLVSHDDEDGDFEPGRRWRSIRMRLGMDIEDEIYRLSIGCKS